MDDQSYAIGEGETEQKNFHLEELTPEELKIQVKNGIFYKITHHKDHFAIHPYWLSSIGQGVHEELRRSLGKWNSVLKGYVVGFEKVTSDTLSAAINEDHKWIHVDVFVTVYLYKPQEGQILNGVIKKIGDNAVICTVFNVFSATVFPQQKQELKKWSIGDELSIEILSIQNRRKGPIIRARSKGHVHYSHSNMQTTDENENWECDEPTTDTTPIKSHKKKNKNKVKSFSNEPEMEMDVVDGTTDPSFPNIETPNLSPKKKRKSQVADKTYLNQSMNIDIGESSSPKKKKKHKKSKDDIDNEALQDYEIENLPKASKKKSRRTD